jgi:uncharacterized protein YhaN
MEPKKAMLKGFFKKNIESKNTYADVATIQLQAEDIRNKHTKTISLILSGIFLIAGFITLFFNWKIGLPLLGISFSFFGISRLEVFATKTNEQAIRKIQAIKKIPAEKTL